MWMKEKRVPVGKDFGPLGTVPLKTTESCRLRTRRGCRGVCPPVDHNMAVSSSMADTRQPQHPAQELQDLSLGDPPPVAVDPPRSADVPTIMCSPL